MQKSALFFLASSCIAAGIQAGVLFEVICRGS